MELFIKTLQRMAELPASELSKLADISSPLRLQKNDIFIVAGQHPRKIAFVISGLFRYYYTDAKGNEFTKGFFPEGSFLSAYNSMVRNEPSYFTIEALEDSSIVALEFENWKKLMASHTGWKDVLITMIEKGFARKEKRERELLIYDAETRYRSFREEYPGLEARVKQNMVASYLGITPVALSRIRKKMGLVNIG